jgi:hypothetical protein
MLLLIGKIIVFLEYAATMDNGTAVNIFVIVVLHNYCKFVTVSPLCQLNLTCDTQSEPVQFVGVSEMPYWI